MQKGGWSVETAGGCGKMQNRVFENCLEEQNVQYSELSPGTFTWQNPLELAGSCVACAVIEGRRQVQCSAVRDACAVC